MSKFALMVDWTRCRGHGLCHELLPESVASDEWGFPLLPDTGAADPSVHDLRRAVAACPSLALRLARTDPCTP